MIDISDVIYDRDIMIMRNRYIKIISNIDRLSSVSYEPEVVL